MHRMTLVPLLLSGLMLAAPAVASEPAHEGGAEHAEAGHDAAGDHGGGDHGEGAHGGAHHGPHYTGDVDNDGTPNWMDADADEEMGDGTYVLPAIGFHLLNLLLLVGVIGWFAGGTIRDGLRTRAIGIKKDLGEAARLRDEAVAAHESISKRLAALQSEVDALRSAAESDARDAEQRIRERADEAARNVVEMAQRQIADEARRATAALKREAVELAVELAEGILTKQMKAGDQRRLAEQFLTTLGDDAPKGDHGHA